MNLIENVFILPLWISIQWRVILLIYHPSKKLYLLNTIFVPCSLLILKPVEKTSPSYLPLAFENIGRLKAVVNQYKNPWPVLSQVFLDKSFYLFVSQFLIYKAKTTVLAVSLPFCVFFQTVSLFGKEVWGLFNNNVAYYNNINS